MPIRRPINFDPYARFDAPVSSTSCLGCKHRRGNGASAWCANTALPPEKRPVGLSMKGCAAFEQAPRPTGANSTSMALSFGHIARRRSGW